MIPFLSLKDVTALHGAEINEAVTRVVNDGWYLQGEENARFEENYSKFIGTKYTVGCANGLDALIWIFRAYIEMGHASPFSVYYRAPDRGRTFLANRSCYYERSSTGDCISQQV